MRIHLQSGSIDELEVAVIKNEVIEESLDELRLGFLVQPTFEENGTRLDIIFDLLVPTSQSQHILTKSGSRYLLKGISKDEFVRRLPEPLLDLVQLAMEHTRRMFIQKNPEHAGIEIKHFDQNYFQEEVRQQMQEQGFIY